MNFLLAEVTENKIAYSEFTDEDTQVTYPRGVIRFTMLQSSVGMNRNDYAVPLFPTETNIPKIGENILVLKLPSALSNEFFKSNVFYYLNNTLAIRERLKDNVFVGMHARTSGTQPLLEFGVSTEVPEDIIEEEDTPKLQPYEGDRIYQSRYGSNIRLGSNNYKDSEKKYQQKKPPWEGAKQFSPILTITNGLDKGDTYIIEKPDKDKSLIYLTTDQKIKITSSQTKIGIGSIPIKNYNKSQVIIASDRIFFNSREDRIILSSKKDVNIATPKWAVNMDTFFTEVENIKIELDNLTTQVTALNTVVTTAFTALFPPSLAPLGTIAGFLSAIKSKIAKITVVLKTLKQ